jgi:hypothetical protein
VIICWFLPLLNLFVPYDVVAEIRTRSNQGEESVKQGASSGGRLVGFWWLSFLAFFFFGTALGEIALIGETEWIFALIIPWALFGCVSAYLAILLVRDITRGQELLAGILFGGTPSARSLSY